MKKSELLRYLFGYFIGGTLFLVIMPLVLLSTSAFCAIYLNIPSLPESPIIDWGAHLLMLIGIVFALWSNVFLLVKGKGGPAEGFGMEISPKTKKLVMEGPYRYTRNPMVFGALCLYYAITLFLRSFGALVFLMVLTALFLIYLKKSEEKRLIKDFGEQYERYRKQISFVIPWPPHT